MPGRGSAQDSERGGARRRPAMPWGEIPRGTTAADGLVVVDKPVGVTSHDVVGAIRRLAGTRKVGHAGTLDPFATGVLVIGIGRATKLLRFVAAADKDYRAHIRLGIGTDTEDLTGAVVEAPGAAGLTDVQIDAALRSLTGPLTQVPSAFSAKKVDGQRAYDLARNGQAVKLAGVPIRVDRFERLSPLNEVAANPGLDGAQRERISGATTASTGSTDTVPVVDFAAAVTCSEGTYVRALARDLGAKLGTAGHLRALRRTRVGAWRIDAARTVEELASEVSAQGHITTASLTDTATAFFPSVEISEEEAWLLRHGQFIKPRLLTGGQRKDGRAVAVREGEAIAVVIPFRGQLKSDVLLQV
ncbi:tRNA pseudouridine(55) synthase TruB [Neoactinobaculum massilliense]|uniref:tRNA pseudouridine(55) synthase TruB n=1 Tax=Neoactinobaculum massilliense TaxID=2364794 RepID=UPI0019D2158C|nr:tRNA pseudouridine(55) synthase TruB [Neoactinobaculum massilliense]